MSSMKSNASSKAFLRNLKLSFDFLRLDNFFFDFIETLGLAKRIGLDLISSQLPVLVTGNILKSCNGAPHREQTNS
jgi:hypothetical protein